MNLAALVMTGMMALAGLTTEPGVTGSGQQTVKMMPDTMEMTVTLVASDEQFDKALATIQQQEADLEKALHGLQTPPAGIESVGPLKGPAGGGDRSAVIRRQMMQAMGRANPEQPAEKAKVTLNMTVTAKWKLAAKDGVALLKETEALQQAVNAAMPKPAAPEAAATEEQEEQTMTAMRDMGEGQQPPGVAAFSFTATLPADKLAEAKAQAYKKARTDAESLAQAAGLKLGALRSLMGSTNGEVGEDVYYYMRQTGRTPRDEGEGVARSTDARELTLTVGVEAVFDIAPAQ
jgi:uncharacterized protein YggE